MPSYFLGMENEVVDVIVVGAGAAGLAAACTLRDAGVNVAILEARGRVGGRIYSYRDPRVASPIELGAEFVHGEAPVTGRIVRQARANVYDVVGDRWRADGGELQSGDDYFRRVQRVLKRLDPQQTPDRSFLEYLHAQAAKAKRASDRRMARDFVEGFHAADVSRISERALARLTSQDDEALGGQTGRVAEGYDRVTAWMARQVFDAISLNTVVEHIEWADDRVTVTARAGGGETVTHSARAAIITVPLSILQRESSHEGGITFEPDITPLREPLSKLAMGHVVRIVFAFKEPFWATRIEHHPQESDPHQLSFLFGRGGDVPVWWTMFPMRNPVMVGWAGGPTGEQLAQYDDHVIAGRALASLAHHLAYSEDQLARLIDGYWIHNWSKDPYTRGAYSYILVDGADAPEALTRPLNDTLYFAGEATDVGGNIGTVEGALASGQRAARGVLEAWEIPFALS